MRTSKGLRISAAAATAATGAICALAVIPASAGAAFDPSFSTQCQGASSIAGRGASFQRTAQLAWGVEALAPDAAPAGGVGFGYATAANGGCGDFKLPAAGGSKKVTFEPRGSGDGRNAVGANTGTGLAGVRDTSVHYGAADEPPSVAQLTAANNGPDGAAGTADDAVLYTVPVAQSSVGVLVKLPDTCTVPYASHQLSRANLEGAFAGNAGFRTWGEILPAIQGADANATAACKAKSFKRIVRLDSSGTTFAFKNYLRDISPTDFKVADGNTTWPNNSGATAVVRPTSNGAGPLLDLLSTQSTDGGIGYADLGAARSRGFDTDVTGTTPSDTDSTFWVRVQRKDQTYQSPALDDKKSATDTGANCKNVTYSDVSTGGLPTVKQSWLDVTSSASAADYPLCALTYALVWEDMAKASVGHAASLPDYTQSQARGVKDFLGYVLNIGGGQKELAPAGYQALPAVTGGTTATAGSVLAIAQAAQKELTWNKSTVVDPGTGGGTGGGGTGGGGTTPTPVTTTPTPTTPTPTVPTVPAVVPTTPKPATPTTPAPAKATVKVSKAAALKGRKVTLSVSPSGAGRVSVSATTGTGKKKVTVATGSATAKKSGVLKVTLKPTSKGRKALKAGRSVKISFKVTFTNADGSKTTSTKTLKVKIKR
ncbi:hypothetical protein [Patulibacter sp.]|uniref:hypothetical protein n=1 Tax=Patulibacter sp. TaxID=1912859 RepID=UPI00271993C3|nr:hypothetical protein [Patulibacter sp.]MDO9409963.1 hypothetical protein [Patulibacter sp.]